MRIRHSFVSTVSLLFLVMAGIACTPDAPAEPTATAAQIGPRAANIGTLHGVPERVGSMLGNAEAADAFFHRQRVGSSRPGTQLRHLRSILAEIEARENAVSATGSDLRRFGDITNWVELGPGNVGGRTRALAIDPSSPDTMYAGGVAGGIWKTTDGGASWRALDDTMGSLAISSIAIDPTNPDIAYCTISTYGMPHIFRSVDGGANWSPIEGSGGDRIPDIPAHWVAIRPSNPDQLYLATELGVFVSDDRGQRWFPANHGLPHTIVESLDFKDDDTLVAFTYGRGVFLSELSDSIALKPRRLKRRAPRSP